MLDEKRRFPPGSIMVASVVLASSAVQAEAEATRDLLDELLVASGRGDERAFAQLYQLTSPWIFHILSRRMGS
ncbi:hypothetical protein I6F37_38620, partial [Bradyrhizobium sp. NBAIM08]|nr:hypothetical protein [Bradyrhizobium sp. NBAIM08]